MRSEPFTSNPLFQAGIAIIIALIPCGLTAAELEESRRPNILFCFADDWGWPHAGVYGDQVIKTPAFDRLAKEGTLFEHAYVSSPSCTPSRNALLTGQQFYRLGKGANLWSTLDVRHPNFMTLLHKSGYEIGHWRKAWGPGNFKEGGYSQHPCGPESDFNSFMKNRDKSQPFCFWFGTSDPHRGYRKGSGSKNGIAVDKVHVPKFLPDTTETRSDIADYYFEVQRWDRDVNRAIKQLEEAGELDNTIIVMSGDHGMPFPRCKGNLYDWGARVPLVIRWGDKVKLNRKITDFVSLTDLAPTFLEAAGLTIPKEMTGNSLLPILKDKNEGRLDSKRNFMVFGRERHVLAQKKPSIEGYPSRAIRTDQWLLIWNLESKRWPAGVPEGATTRKIESKYADCDAGPTKRAIMKMRDNTKKKRFYDLCFAKRPAFELYDCKNDPDQIHNLAADPRFSGTIEELQARLIRSLQTTGDPRFTNKLVEFDQFSFPW